MSAARSGAIVAVWAALLFVLPFQEGSGAPAGLLLAHLLVVGAVGLTWGAAGGPRREILLPAMGVLAAAAVSGALGGYRYASLLAIVDLGAALAILLVAEAAARAQPGFARGCLLAIVAAGLVQAGGILMRALGSLGTVRSPGTLLNPNHTAAYLMIAFWALMALSGRETERRGPAGAEDGGAGPSARLRSPGWTWVRLAAGSALLAAALLQASRGALAGGVAGAATLLALRWRALPPRVRRIALGASLAAGLAGGALVLHRLETRDDPYAWDRLRVWQTALAVARRHPIFGVGPGVFGHVTYPLDPAHATGPVRFAKHVEATHSDPLRALAETGIVGTAALVWLGSAILLLGVGAVRARASGGATQRRRGGAASPLDAALAAALAGLLVQSAAENLSMRPAVFYTGALLAALWIARAPGRDRRSALAADGIAPRGQAIRDDDQRPALVPEQRPRPGAPARIGALPVRPVLIGGLLAWAAAVLVVAPFLGYREFQAYQEGRGPRGERYRAALLCSPLHPDYHAALAEAVLAGRSSRPEDLAAGFHAIDEAIALKPIDARLILIKARLARQAFLASGGEASWFSMADENYIRAIPLDPLRPQGHLERGWMLLGAMKAQEALHEADASLASEPNAFEARRLRASALKDLSRLDESRTEVREALQRRDQVRAYVPQNPYETQVLTWNHEGWAALERQLGMPEA